MDPSNNKVLYAATYQRRRATWGFNGGGPGSAMWKSSDAGRTWTKLTQGVPTGPLGRIGMDVYRAEPEHPLRAHRAREGKRHLSLGRRRPDVAEDVEHQSAADVLQPDPHRSEQRLAHLRARRADSHLRRRRQDLHRERRAAFRPSRDVDQPEELEPHHRRQRRRHRHQLRQGRELGSASTTWTSGSSTTSPTTWRRPTTSAAACRTTTPGAGRARCAAAPASPTTTGSRSRAATASRRRSIRRTRASSTPSRRTATSRASIKVSNERKSIRPLPARGEPPLRWNWNTPILMSPHDSDDDLRRRQQGVQVAPTAASRGRRSAPT